MKTLNKPGLTRHFRLIQLVSNTPGENRLLFEAQVQKTEDGILLGERSLDVFQMESAEAQALLSARGVAMDVQSIVDAVHAIGDALQDAVLEKAIESKAAEAQVAGSKAEDIDANAATVNEKALFASTEKGDTAKADFEAALATAEALPAEVVPK